ncbi:Methyltransferase type 11 [Desulfarculus baarsii DSM 2075]|uniref:Methyltransferase type 11 n=1 Tax=Desulfarculus baarsii (strain ATCC 33931 / DSM 2075 / LMG 7858 / VKM B-1802 / 2st14) TaxID=644282 RepID=E1QHM2_DESB2|nr:Methyltransferase type 11 [Desulfarculus baarsii DSM 2075]
MAEHVCPVWVGYLLLSPLRKLMESPRKLLGSYISPGMTVLEPGCGMGFFTLPVARMVGPEGKVVAVDIQPKMLQKVRARAASAKLLDRIETRLATGDVLGLEDLAGGVDFALALHVVHELKDQAGFFREIHEALKPGGRLLVVEPRGHVSADNFAEFLALAHRAGLETDPAEPPRGLRALLVKPERKEQ